MKGRYLKMALVKVPENREEELLQEFCDSSAFTFEGLDITDKQGMADLEKTLRENGYEQKDFVIYWFKGSVMNRCYGLTGNNAYSDDLTFAVIPNYYNPMIKLLVGARWFDDIVANNSIRQNAINSGTKPDYN